MLTKKSLSQYCLAPAGHTFQGQQIRTTQNIETVHLKQSLRLVPNDLLNSDPYSTLVARNSTKKIYESNIQVSCFTRKVQRKERNRTFKLKKKKKKSPQQYLFFIMISLVLKYSTDITIVNMLRCFLSFPNSFTIISLKSGSPIQESLAFMVIASLTFYEAHLPCTSMLTGFSTSIQKGEQTVK